MRAHARLALSELGLTTVQNINQTVETLSGGQRQGVAVARAAAFASRVIIMDEPTAALGVKESRKVLELILKLRSKRLPVVPISHNMPQVFEVADRIHIHRLGSRACVIKPTDYSMSDAVAIMTGAMKAKTQSLSVVKMTRESLVIRLVAVRKTSLRRRWRICFRKTHPLMSSTLLMSRPPLVPCKRLPQLGRMMGAYFLLPLMEAAPG